MRKEVQFSDICGCEANVHHLGNGAREVIIRLPATCPDMRHIPAELIKTINAQLVSAPPQKEKEIHDARPTTPTKP